jgi:ATP synthase protein I
MVKKKPSNAFEDFDSRLRKAREGDTFPWRKSKSGSESEEDNGSQRRMLGTAFRIGVDMVVALAVGFWIGKSLDQWLGSGPWLMLVFLLLGGAAGMLNVYRYARGFGSGVGNERKDEREDDQRT